MMTIIHHHQTQPAVPCLLSCWSVGGDGGTGSVMRRMNLFNPFDRADDGVKLLFHHRFVRLVAVASDDEHAAVVNDAHSRLRPVDALARPGAAHALGLGARDGERRIFVDREIGLLFFQVVDVAVLHFAKRNADEFGDRG